MHYINHREHHYNTIYRELCYKNLYCKIFHLNDDTINIYKKIFYYENEKDIIIKKNRWDRITLLLNKIKLKIPTFEYNYKDELFTILSYKKDDFFYFFIGNYKYGAISFYYDYINKFHKDGDDDLNKKTNYFCNAFGQIIKKYNINTTVYFSENDCYKIIPIYKIKKCIKLYNKMIDILKNEIQKYIFQLNYIKIKNYIRFNTNIHIHIFLYMIKNNIIMNNDYISLFKNKLLYNNDYYDSLYDRNKEENVKELILKMEKDKYIFSFLENYKFKKYRLYKAFINFYLKYYFDKINNDYSLERINFL